ncbi:Protein of unknown function [Cotesia congregata]|uniref:Uncharacterized protein n=1 Tax=Cotesia congregata TaxID=51543 RepID=A0A8J2HLM7_COTCN|nr:Protein of unknown function [Cotesia congregata]
MNGKTLEPIKSFFKFDHLESTQKKQSNYLISGRSMLSNTCSGTPRRQSAMSSSSLVIEQLSCSPTFRLRLLGSCTEAQGLRAEPLNSITLCSKPIHTIKGILTGLQTFKRKKFYSVLKNSYYLES